MSSYPRDAGSRWKLNVAHFAMPAMRSLPLFAVLIAVVASGCAGSRLLSRAPDDEDDRPLRNAHRDEGLRSNEKRLDELRSDSDHWNIAQQTELPSENTGINQARPSSMDLPVSEHLSRAKLAYDAQRLTESRQHLDAILRQQPAHPEAHHRLAVIADLEGRFGDAEHHYHAALESDSNNVLIVGDLGYSYMLAGRTQEAEQVLLQARALDPRDQNSAWNLAVLYSGRGDVAGAQHVLSEAYPSNEAAQRLAQLFPGLPINASANAPQFAMTPAAPTQPMINPAADPTQYQAAMVSPYGGATTSPPPQDSYAAQGTPAYGDPYQQFAAMPNVSPPGTSSYIQQSPPPSIAPRTSQPVVTAAAERSWPPAIWSPPSTGSGPIVQAGATSPAAQSRSGVVYLMDRRSGAPAAPPASSNLLPLPAAPAGSPTGPFSAPAQVPSANDPQVRYENGPGSSRIVTWANLNGQSVDNPPLPPKAEQLRSAATSQPDAGSGLSNPIAQRSSPGTASGWNGGVYPPPQRQLPAGRPTIYDYPPQGSPLMAPAPSAAASQPTQFPEPHAGFEIAPAPAPPENPLSGYEAERRKFDQQFQQQIDRSYAQSPTGFVQSPTVQMQVPTFQPPTYQSPQAPTGQTAPLTPNGTPWPGGRPPTMTAPTLSPPTMTTPASPSAPATGSTPPRIVPAPYRPRAINGSTTTTGDYFAPSYSGPIISPAP